MNAEEIAKAVYQTRFRYSNEKELQHGIGALLTSLGLRFQPEVSLSPGNRIDFLVEPGIGIEVKTHDSTGGVSLSSVTRQLFRYCEHTDIKELILVTTLSKHRRQPDEMGGKPLYVVYLLTSFL